MLFGYTVHYGDEMKADSVVGQLYVISLNPEDLICLNKKHLPLVADAHSIWLCFCTAIWHNAMRTSSSMLIEIKMKRQVYFSYENEIIHAIEQ